MFTFFFLGSFNLHYTYCAFTNMRILKFKSQLTIAFFAAVNHLKGPLRKQNFTLTGSKGQGLWFVICDWWISIRFVCFCVLRFVACDRNYDWRQWKTQLWRRLMNFRVRMFVKSAVRLKTFFLNGCPFIESFICSGINDSGTVESRL